MRPGRLIPVALLLVAASCSRAPSAPAASSVVVGTAEPVTSLDPALCYEVFCSEVVLPNTHEGLVRLDPSSMEPAPALARSWTVSPDGTTYTFTLRTGVRFHDGKAFDAGAMKASLERVRSLAGSGGPGFLLFDTVNEPPQSGIVAIDAPSATSLVIRLAQPDSAFLAKMADPVADAVSPSYPPDRTAGPGVLVGTGPYRLAKGGYEGGVRIVLVRNERYWGRKARVGRAEIRVFAGAGPLAAAVRSGDVDVAFRSLGPHELAGLKGKAGLRAISGPGAAVRFLGVNVATPPFTSADVRGAIAAAVDRPRLASRTLGGAVQPLYSMVPRGIPGHRDDFRSDWGDANLPLVRGKLPSSSSFAIDLWYTPTHYGDTERAVAEAVKTSLEATGRFSVSLRAQEWADYKSSLSSGALGLFLLGWFPDYLDPLDYLAPFVQSGFARALGTNYAAPDVDALLAEAGSTQDAVRRADIVQALQKRISADVPYAPLYQARQIAVVRAGVSGLTLDMTQQLRLAALRKS